MFGFLKRLFAQRDAVAEDIAAILSEEDQKWIAMRAEELLALDDVELVSAAIARICAVTDSFEDENEKLLHLDDVQKTVYVVYGYESEVNNGGLCQYFVNDSRLSAPMLAEALEAIGAVAHKMHFERFVEEHSIDLRDLESFAIGNAKQFAKMEKRYPFEAFDDAFYEMPSIEGAMAAYIRKNILKF